MVMDIMALNVVSEMAIMLMAIESVIAAFYFFTFATVMRIRHRSHNAMRSAHMDHRPRGPPEPASARCAGACLRLRGVMG